MLSTCTSVYGVIDVTNNTKYNDYVRVAEACISAGIALPNEVVSYFTSLDIDINTKEWKEKHESLIKLPTTEIHPTDMQEGVELKVSDIPAGVKTIRFINSY